MLLCELSLKSLVPFLASVLLLSLLLYFQLFGFCFSEFVIYLPLYWIFSQVSSVRWTFKEVLFSVKVKISYEPKVLVGICTQIFKVLNSFIFHCSYRLMSKKGGTPSYRWFVYYPVLPYTLVTFESTDIFAYADTFSWQDFWE